MVRSQLSRAVAGTLLALALPAALSCSNPPDPEAPAPPQAEHIGFGFVIFFLPLPIADPISGFKTLVTHGFGDFRQGPEVPGSADVSFVSVDRVELTGSKIPTLDLVRAPFGQGLTPDQVAGLTASRSAAVLKFGISRQHLWRDLRNAYRLAGAFARSTGGVIYDIDTLEFFSLDAWEQKRVATWVEELPDVANLILTYRVPGPVGARAVTRGMKKFDLPDLAVEAFPTSTEQQIDGLIDSLAQAEVEGSKADAAGDLTLRLKDLHNAAARRRIHLLPNAQGEALLRLRPARRQENGPNRLTEIVFDRYPEADPSARQRALLSALFGTEERKEPLSVPRERL